jgi:NAD-dependent DNA ligase
MNSFLNLEVGHRGAQFIV